MGATMKQHLGAIGILMLAACGSNGGSGSQPAEAHDYEAASERASEQLADQTYQEVAGSADCTEGCEGHDAGFEWAKENGITDPSECSGDSQSFIEGCQSYAATLETKTEEEVEEPSEEET